MMILVKNYEKHDYKFWRKITKIAIFFLQHNSRDEMKAIKLGDFE